MQTRPMDNCPIENPSTTEKFSMPTLIEETKPARQKDKDFLVENSSTSAVFSIEILVEEIEWVVAQNYKFEYRAKSIIRILWNIWTVDCHETDACFKTKGCLIESCSTNGKCSMETLVGGIIPVVTEKSEFDYRKKTKILNFVNLSDCRDFDRKIINIGFSTESSSTNVRLSVGSLMEQIKPIVVEK